MLPSPDYISLVYTRRIRRGKWARSKGKVDKFLEAVKMSRTVRGFKKRGLAVVGVGLLEGIHS